MFYLLTYLMHVLDFQYVALFRDQNAKAIRVKIEAKFWTVFDPLTLPFINYRRGGLKPQ